MKVSGACAFARPNTSHYSITVIEAEGCRGGPRGSPVSDPFPPPVAITTDQIGAARQKSYWISAAKAGRFQDIHGVKHHLRHAIPARTSPKRCFLSDMFLFFFQSVTFKHVWCKTEKAAQGLWKWASGAEKTKRLSKASLEARN